MEFNFQAITDSVKKHPALVIGGGVILFLVLRSGGTASAASSSGATAAQPDPNAQLSANTQLQMAAISGGNQLQLAGVEANVQLASLSAERDVQMASLAASRESQLAAIAGERELGQLASVNQLAALTAQTTVAIKTLEAGQYTANLNAQTQQLSIATSGEVQLEQIKQQGEAIQTMTQGQVDMAWINADVSKTSIYANRDIAITQSNNQVAIADINAGASASGDMWGAVGSIAGLFSDRRTKCNVVEKGVMPNGLMLYEYEYKPEFQAEGGTGRKCGFMADDVEKLYPDAVSRGSDGYARVIYSRIPTC